MRKTDRLARQGSHSRASRSISNVPVPTPQGSAGASPEGFARHALRRAAAPVLCAGADGRLLFANEAASEIYGLDAQSVDAPSIFDLDVGLKPATWAGHCAGVRERGSWTYESMHRNAEGRAFPVEVFASWLEYEGESSYLAVVHDLTARKRHEADLIKARKEAEEMNRLKTDFIAKISHEVRTPLASIIGFASILGEEIPERHRKFIRFIERSGKRLLETVNAMFSLSMLSSGTTGLRHEVILVGACVEEKAEQMRALIEEKNLRFTLNLPERDVTALLDREGLDRMLEMMLGNAVEGTAEGSIHVAVRDLGSRVEIRVADTGAGTTSSPFLPDTGMPEGAGPDLSFDGFGLTVTLTRELVHLMGGDFAREANKAEGNTFVVSFPSLHSAPGQTVPEMSERHPPARRSGKPRALVIEDGPEMLVLLRHYLGKDFEVTTMTDGEGVCARMREQPFDVVLMDINLGGAYTGIDLLREIRLRDPHTPVIAVTAYALPGDRDHLIDQGFAGYVGKPFTKKELHTVIGRVLAGASAAEPDAC